MIQAVLDVNVLVSSTVGPLGHSRQLLTAWQDQRFTLLTSEGMIVELEEKLRLPRISQRYKLTEEDIRFVVGLLRTQAQLVMVPAEEQRVVTSDPEDDYVLATARLGQAQYLVTGDRNLLNMGEYEEVTIITPREFLEIFQSVGKGL